VSKRIEQVPSRRRVRTIRVDLDLVKRSSDPVRTLCAELGVDPKEYAVEAGELLLQSGEVRVRIRQ
jgi:hypothetical protein